MPLPAEVKVVPWSFSNLPSRELNPPVMSRASFILSLSTVKPAEKAVQSPVRGGKERNKLGADSSGQIRVLSG